MKDILQGDLFPNRETVGTENVVVMIAKFEDAHREEKSNEQRN